MAGRRGGWVVLAGMLVVVAGRDAGAEVRTFPGPTPCDGTLAACIAGATEGDVVQLATDGPIDESILVEKSLTVEAAAGFSPTLAATRSVAVHPADPARTVVVRGLTLLDGSIDVYTSGDAAHSVTVTDCKVTQSGTTGSHGIDVTFTSPGTVVVERNEIVSDGYPLSLTTGSGSGTIAASLSSNRVRKRSAGNSATGLELDLRGAFTITADVQSNVVSDVADCNCGGAVALAVSTSDTASATVNVVNNTIDLSGDEGIRVYSPGVGQLLVVNLFNNVVTRATTGLYLPAANPRLTVDNGHNDFFDNTAGPNFGGYVADPSTLAVDPLYVSLVSRDYHLQSGSLLRNAGTNAPPGGLSTLDADGNIRIAEATVDIGAYEFGSSPPTTTTSTTLTPGATTTTTLPGCPAGATAASVLCRLDELAAAVQARVPAGPLAVKLANLVARARAGVATAEEATKRKARKRALAAAIRATAGVGKKLRSRKAKDLDGDTRSVLTAMAESVRDDLKTLRSQ